jgi:hypothetical protein
LPTEPDANAGIVVRAARGETGGLMIFLPGFGVHDPIPRSHPLA